MEKVGGKGGKKEREDINPGGNIRNWRCERGTEGQEIELRCVDMEDGELGVTTRKSQIPGKQESPRTQLDYISQDNQHREERTCRDHIQRLDPSD